jgi:hypothetical protein
MTSRGVTSAHFCAWSQSSRPREALAQRAVYGASVTSLVAKDKRISRSALCLTTNVTFDRLLPYRDCGESELGDIGWGPEVLLDIQL